MAKNPSILSNFCLTVDDAGMSEDLDKIIIRLAQERKIDCVSIVVNVGDLELLKESLTKSGIKKALHLNSTQSVADFNESFIHSLSRRLSFLYTVFLSKNGLRTIEKVWEEQINVFIKTFGEPPDILNSHEHVHLLPGLYLVAVRLNRKYHIPQIRAGSLPARFKDIRPLLFSWFLKIDATLDKDEVFSMVHSWNWQHYSWTEMFRILSPNSEIIFHVQNSTELSFLERVSDNAVQVSIN